MRQKEDCLFCKIAQKKIPAVLAYEDRDIIAFNDINPQAPAHIVVIPKDHIEKISDLGETEASVSSKLISAGNRIAKDKGLLGHGYRFVINCGKDAGQEVFHIHMHILGGRKLGWPPG